MTTYRVIDRRRDERGVFMIFLKGTDFKKCVPGNELGIVKARTGHEAEIIACARGIGNCAPIWAIEYLSLDSARVTVQEG